MKRAVMLALALALAACSAPAPPLEESARPPAATAPQTTIPAPQTTAPALNEVRYSDARLLERHDRSAESLELPGLRALVAPHYAPMLYMLASLLKSAAQSGGSFDAVLVIGPDHTGAGVGMTISGRGWTTAQGDLPGADRLFSALMADRGIGFTENDELLQSDHAVSTLMPYVAKYLPETPVLAVLVGKYTGYHRLLSLAKAVFAAQGEGNVLLVCSTDFSHYQTPDAAADFDRQTIAAIEDFDIGGLLKMDSKNTDSPECLTVFLELARLWGAAPELICRDTDFYVENGEYLAGSYMAWALVAGDE